MGFKGFIYIYISSIVARLSWAEGSGVIILTCLRVQLRLVQGVLAAGLSFESVLGPSKASLCWNKVGDQRSNLAKPRYFQFSSLST